MISFLFVYRSFMLWFQARVLRRVFVLLDYLWWMGFIVLMARLIGMSCPVKKVFFLKEKEEVILVLPHI